jgi:hypothetical protein
MSQMDQLVGPCADACCAPPALVLPSNLADDRMARIETPSVLNS